jgi:DNA sulfur modification protein DndD
VENLLSSFMITLWSHVAPILYLLRKPDFVHRVQIDTETFKLSLYDQDGELLPKHRLSAGEKQILAIALLWGLAQASGRQLPVAIDTQLRLYHHRGIGYGVTP